MKTPSVVRTVYLYLFSLIGLCLVVIGGVRLVDMGLKAFIFTAADEAQKSISAVPPYPPVSDKDIKNKTADGVELSVEDKAALEQWRADYERWQTAESKRNYVNEERSREAASSLAFILIGLPLYFYHWSVVRRESSKKEE